MRFLGCFCEKTVTAVSLGDAGGPGHGRGGFREGGTLAAALTHLIKPSPVFLTPIIEIHPGQTCSSKQQEE